MTVVNTVLLAIPTYRRPEATSRLLDALGRERYGQTVTILVLDNDPAGSARSLGAHPVVQASGGRAIGVTGGMGSVRNAALAAAAELECDFIAFIDDDMVPILGWLAALLEAQVKYHADLVVGSIQQPPELGRLPHVRAALARNLGRGAGPMRGDISSGNLLISRSFITRCDITFDEALDSSGAEDTWFGRQARVHGAVVAYAPAASTVEMNVASSVTPGKLFKRSVANGRSLAHLDLLAGKPLPLPARLARAVVVVPLAAAGSLTAIVRSDASAFWTEVFRLGRNVGRLAGPSASRTGPYDGLGVRENSSVDAVVKHVSVAGFKVADATQDKVIDALVALTQYDRATRAYAVHASSLNSQGDMVYLSGLRAAEVVYADGVSGVLLAKLAGAKHIERSPTTDVGWHVLSRFADIYGRPARVALVGGHQGLAESAAAVMKTRGVADVVFTSDGYPADWGGLFGRLSEVGADVIYLGLGSPYEVGVCEAHLDKLSGGVVITSGGWFGFIVGSEDRAPSWAQRSGMEWAYRLRQQPRRLVGRYTKAMGNTVLLGGRVIATRALDRTSSS